MRRLRVAAAATLFLALAPHAAAQQQPRAPEALAKVYDCAAIGDNVQRLACFDAAVTSLKTAETQGQFAAVDSAGMRQIEREAFGFSLPSLPRLGFGGLRRADGAPAEPDRTPEMSMTIARVGSFDGRQSFVMDNGQVWVVIGNEGNRLARVGGAVTIKRAMMDSYLMSVPAGGTALRVRRAE